MALLRRFLIVFLMSLFLCALVAEADETKSGEETTQSGEPVSPEAPGEEATQASNETPKEETTAAPEDPDEDERDLEVRMSSQNNQIVTRDNVSCRRNRCYVTANCTKTRNEASQYCEQAGGRIAAVTREAESDELKSLLTSEGLTEAWIGNRKGESIYQWQAGGQTLMRQGCFDVNDGRNRSADLVDDAMTLDQCLDKCNQLSKPMASIAYEQENTTSGIIHKFSCYCDNLKAIVRWERASPQKNEICDIPCRSNATYYSSNLCGGNKPSLRYVYMVQGSRIGHWYQDCYTCVVKRNPSYDVSKIQYCNQCFADSGNNETIAINYGNWLLGCESCIREWARPPYNPTFMSRCGQCVRNWDSVKYRKWLHRCEVCIDRVLTPTPTSMQYTNEACAAVHFDYKKHAILYKQLSCQTRLDYLCTFRGRSRNSCRRRLRDAVYLRSARLCLFIGRKGKGHRGQAECSRTVQNSLPLKITTVAVRHELMQLHVTSAKWHWFGLIRYDVNWMDMNSSYTDWAPQFPKNGHGKCISMSGNNLKWQNMGCNMEKSFICRLPRDQVNLNGTNNVCARPTPTPNPNDEPGLSRGGRIALITVGSLAGAGLLAALVALCCSQAVGAGDKKGLIGSAEGQAGGGADYGSTAADAAPSAAN